MSNGNLSKQPKLSSRPPALNTTQTLERLEVLDEWSEQPAKIAADAISHEQVSSPQPVKENKPKKREIGERYPWDDITDINTKQPLYMRVPLSLYLKLKWLGDTTYGTDMTTITIEAVEAKVNKMLKERGIKT